MATEDGVQDDSVKAGRPDLEYQTAQDSAQHHDQLIWTTAGIIWGASLVLLGFVLSGTGESVAARVVLTVVAAFGMTLILVVWGFQSQWRAVRRRKYEACWKLEESQGFIVKHHTRERNEYRGKMTCWYGFVSVAFLVVWLVVILGVWWPAAQ